MASRLIALCFFTLLLLCLATCNPQQHFLKCLSTNSSAKPETYIYSRGSPKYWRLLNNAEKNLRWFNSTSSALPFFVVAPYTEVQIQSSLLCSKKLGFQVRIKSGGHDYEGLSFRSKTRSRFIMIDLCRFTSIDININEETAWIQTGVNLGQLYHLIAQKSDVHAFPGGLYPSVGSGGHISGGGYGTLSRKYGLAADNVIDARVMDANGKIFDRKNMGEEFFWAIRGGGGASFGVILSWKLNLVTVPKLVTAFVFRRKLDSTTIPLIQKWQQNVDKFPEDLFIRVLIQNSPPINQGGKQIVQISFQGLYLGTVDKLVPLLEQNFSEFELNVEDCFRDPTAKKNCTEKPCVEKECYQIPWIRSVLYFAGLSPKDPLEYLVSRNNSKPGYYKGKSDFVTAPIPSNGWKMIKKMFLQEDAPMMILEPFGGKMSRISEHEIPFPHRKGNLYAIQYLVRWSDNHKRESRSHIEWIRRIYEEMKPFVSKSPRGAYLNYRDLDLGINSGGYEYDEASSSWGSMYFKSNFERLATVKGRVDPNNFFKFEQSIPLFPS